MTAKTKDQVRDAIRALGYDPAADNVMSLYADTEQIIVRRIEKIAAGWAVVEDVTVLDPGKVPARQRPDSELGFLVTTAADDE